MAVSSRLASRRCGLGLVALAAALACASEAPSEGWSFLHVVPTYAEPDLDLSRGLRVAFYLESPERVAELLAERAVERVEVDHLVLRLDTYPGRLDADPALHTQASFVIDYDSEEVEAWARQVAAEQGSAVSPEAIIDAVRTIIEPLGGRGFELASQIARNRRGDCTEHAVLFAALARRFGHPTRVAFGSVLADVGGSVHTYGHAWNEIYEAGAWHPIDATPIQGARALAYVPYGFLADEGPGYALGVLEQIMFTPRRVEVLGSVPSD